MTRHPRIARLVCLSALAAAALLVVRPRIGAAADASPAAAAAEHKVNVGLQLYSLRNQFPKDVPGTMAEVEQWQITDVEAAGTYNLSAEQFKAELDKHHLRASGAHYQWDRLLRDMDGVIKEAKALGVEYVTLPWIPHKGDTFSAEEAKTAAERFNEWGKKLAEAGLKFTYHPHGYEFRPAPDGNGTLFDLIAQNTDPKYANFELDIFWAFDGGADPVKLMQKYPDRFVQMHLKDMRKGLKTPNYTGHEDTENDVALGTGQLDLKAILEEATKIGIKHYYIEDESKSSEKQIPESVQFVRSVGY